MSLGWLAGVEDRRRGRVTVRGPPTAPAPLQEIAVSSATRREVLAQIADIERHLRNLPPHSPSVDPADLHDRLRRLRSRLRDLDRARDEVRPGDATDG